MKKEDFLKLGLSEEQATKAAEASQEELKGFIPKARFDEVNEAKKKPDEDIKARDEQLEALKKIDADDLKAEIERLQGENEAAKKQYEADLQSVKVNNAVEMALAGAKAKNIKAVKALLELDKAELDGDKVRGLEEQIKALKEADDTKFLFEAETAKKPEFKGFNPGESKDPSKSSQNIPQTLAGAIAAHLSSAQS